MSATDPTCPAPAEPAARPAVPPRRAPAAGGRDAREGAAAGSPGARRVRETPEGRPGRGSRSHEQLEGQLVLPGCEDPELERCRARHPATRRRATTVEAPAQLVGDAGPRRSVVTPGVIRVVD